MTLSVKYLLENKDGVESLFYPITHEAAVHDSNGNVLETKLRTITIRTETNSNAISVQDTKISSLLARLNLLIEQGVVFIDLEGTATSIGKLVNQNWPWLINL